MLKGLGNKDTLKTSAHGAGRRLSRQEARKEVSKDIDLRVITPIDMMASEVPNAYRPIENVVMPMAENNMVNKVAQKEQ